MKNSAKIALGTTGAVVAAGLALGGRRLADDRHYARMQRALALAPNGLCFEESMVADLPEPVQRYFLHAIRPGTPLVLSVRLTLSGRMRPRADAPFIDLKADEILAPQHGFLWTAQFKKGHIPGRVVDFYFDEKGGFDVRMLGLFPIVHTRDEHVTKSSVGRLAAESIWCPAALLPQNDVQWIALDHDHIQANFAIDYEPISFILRLSPAGRVLTLTMERHSQEGREDWGPTPYGFAFEAEDTFGGYTLPTRAIGGWYYGTPRFDEENASQFTLENAFFKGDYR